MLMEKTCYSVLLQLSRKIKSMIPMIRGSFISQNSQQFPVKQFFCREKYFLRVLPKLLGWQHLSRAFEAYNTFSSRLYVAGVVERSSYRLTLSQCNLKEQLIGLGPPFDATSSVRKHLNWSRPAPKITIIYFEVLWIYKTIELLP